MSTEEKYTTLTTKKIPQTFEAGKDAEWNAFWDSFQNYGNRTSYALSLGQSCWNDTTFKPKYDINIAGAANQLFYRTGITNMVSILQRQGVKLDVSQATQLGSMFAYGAITHCPTIDLTGCSVTLGTSIFDYCTKLISVDGYVVVAGSVHTNSFRGCSNLEHIIFSGVIGTNLSLSACTKLDHDSLMSVINCLEDKTSDTSGTDWVVTLGSTNLAKLTEEEQEIAKGKGWRLA